jgi:hypothetical protein
MATYVGQRVGITGWGFSATSSAGGGLTSSCTAGNTVIFLFSGQTTTLPTVTSITDSKGNTWTIDVQNNAQKTVVIASTRQNAGTLLSTDNITINLASVYTGNIDGFVLEFSGQYVFDVGATNSGTSGTSLASGTTAATASTDEFACVMYHATKSGATATYTWTKDANYTSPATFQLPSSATATRDSDVIGYRLLSATGAQSATYVVNNTSNGWGASIATYKPAPTSTPVSGTDANSTTTEIALLSSQYPVMFQNYLFAKAKTANAGIISVGERIR